MLITSINRSLNELVDLLGQLSKEEYSNPCNELSGASIGEHSRHIIEMFQCLEYQYETGVIHYDKRARNVNMQTDHLFAIQHILQIQENINKENKILILNQVLDGDEIQIQSNYYRELLYNLEHCIHHQALIKVAILNLEHIVVHTNFGVARSTIEYRNKCAQ